jgi:hypothetical protein
MFDDGADGSPGGVFAGSLKVPSGASQSRNTSSFTNPTRTLAVPAVKVYDAPSAAKSVTSPSVSEVAALAGAPTSTPATTATAAPPAIASRRQGRTKLLI